MKKSLLILVAAIFAANVFGQSFDCGDTTYVFLDDPITEIGAETNTLTIEAWVKPDTVGGFNDWAGLVFLRDVVDFTSASGLCAGAYSAHVSDSIPIAWNWNDIYWIGTDAFFDIGVWNHVAMTVSATDIKTYKNGQLVHTWTPADDVDYEGTEVPVENWDGIITFGKDRYHETWTGRVWNGGIDEVRIWNKTLNDTEIAATWNTKLNGDETDLVAYYDFTTVIGSVVTNGGVGPTGTIFGADHSITEEGFGPNSITEKATLDNVNVHAWNNIVYIQNGNGQANLEIYAITGQLVKSQQINGDANIQLSENNIYLVKVSNEKGVYVSKVLVK
jgi:Concanavalin A-like lectin/glucanases superfamily